MAALSEKIGYGLGDMASSMFWKIFSYYLPIFYSDVFGLRATHAATLLLITKLYDAVSDPLMGLLADRTQTRWGKYRPYLLWMAFPFAAVGILSFYVPDAAYTVKHVYAYVMYILMMSVYTAVNVPYGALLGVVSTDSRERSVFSSFRMFFAYVGSFVAMGVFWIFERAVTGKVNAAGRTIRGVGDADPSGWLLTVAIVAVACAVLFILCFTLTRERVQATPQQEKGSVREDLRRLLGNGPWWLLLAAGIGQLLFASLRGGAAAYYFANILGGNVFLSCAFFLILGEIAQMLGVTLAVPLSTRLGKRGTFRASLLFAAVVNAAIFWIPAGTGGLWILIACQILVALAVGVGSPLIWSMFSDIAEDSRRRHGTLSTGLIFSSSSMAQKFGGAFGGFFLLMILGAAGYQAASAEQTAGVLTAIRSLMSWIPSIGALLSVVCLSFYPLRLERNRDE